MVLHHAHRIPQKVQNTLQQTLLEYIIVNKIIPVKLTFFQQDLQIQTY